MERQFFFILLFAILSSCESKPSQEDNDIYRKLDHSIEYIDPDSALFSDGFEVCNEDFICNYYNPERARYVQGKNKDRFT